LADNAPLSKGIIKICYKFFKVIFVSFHQLYHKTNSLKSVLRYTCTYKRKEMFEDTKGQIRSSKSKPGQTIQRPDEKG
jgi:hypothetical protein